MSLRASVSTKNAFTLVELLVVIAIIGILVSLTMPAIQSARESGRRTQCLNNIRNLGQASQLHLEGHKFFPTGGWGYAWGGDPDRGYDQKQPGGWGYNLLVYIEETSLRKLGASGDPKTLTQAKKDASRTRAMTIIPVYLCPTRGRQNLVANSWPDAVNLDLSGVPEVAKIDYAINGGSVAPNAGHALGFTPGPGIAALSQNDQSLDANYSAAQLNCDGISHCRSAVRPAHINDGTSKTYLIGEKYLNYVRDLNNAISGDDNQSWEVGFDWDSYRFTEVAPDFEQNPDSTAMSTNFGSAHATGFNMSFCDGSTRFLPYDIDLATHQALGGRKDGGPTDSFPGQ
jgi:prepilin-type N-terminal cleavage/methylation domain-containing protein/prepilin-type processing-associated H-X9-DG protein